MRPVLIFLLGLSLFACQFGMDTNLEAIEIPGKNTLGIDAKLYIDSCLYLMYPKISKYDLEFEKNSYKAEFLIGGNDFKIHFDDQGNWKKSIIKIRYKENIPDKVIKTIKSSEYNDWMMTEMNLTQQAAAVQYKIEFRKEDKEWDVYFDGAGTIIKTKEKTYLE